MTGAELLTAYAAGQRSFAFAYLGGAYLGGANLRGADLGGAYLRGADLGGANLGGANLGGAYLGDADLGGANLGGAYLGGANLRGADLGGANLRGADLGGANLGGANLGGAYLGDADLGGAYLGGADLGGATAPNGRRCVGRRPYAEVGPIGSRSDRLVVWLTEGHIYVVAGCWHSGDAEDGLTALEARVSAVHGDSEHGVQYLAAIDYLRTHVALWADAVEREETER